MCMRVLRKPENHTRMYASGSVRRLYIQNAGYTVEQPMKAQNPETCTLTITIRFHQSAAFQNSSGDSIRNAGGTSTRG